MAGCRVTFIGHRFSDFEHGQRELVVSVDVEDGDYQAVILKAMQEGGVFMPDAEEDRKWFMPWPPASIAIDPLP